MNADHVKRLCELTNVKSSNKCLLKYNNEIEQVLGLTLNESRDRLILVEREKGHKPPTKMFDKYDILISAKTPEKVVEAFTSSILTNNFGYFFTSIGKKLGIKERQCEVCGLKNKQKYGSIPFDEDETKWDTKEYFDEYKKLWEKNKNTNVQIDQAHHADRPTMGLLAAKILMTNELTGEIDEYKQFSLKHYVQYFIYLHHNIPMYYLCSLKCHHYYDNKLGIENHDYVYDNMSIRDITIKKFIQENKKDTKNYNDNCKKKMGISKRK